MLQVGEGDWVGRVVGQRGEEGAADPGVGDEEIDVAGAGLYGESEAGEVGRGRDVAGEGDEVAVDLEREIARQAVSGALHHSTSGKGGLGDLTASAAT